MIKPKKIAVIYEALCIGCGACVKQCPFNAIRIVRIPRDLEVQTTHRYGPNLFKLHRLPIPRQGEVLGLVGSNGTGKSTALKILTGKLKPNLGDTSGAAKSWTWPEVIARLGVWSGVSRKALQGYFRAVVAKRLTVAYKPQNVELLRAKLSNVTVRRVLSRLKLSEGSERVVGKLSLTTLLDSPLSHLSGGELQRVAILLTAARTNGVYILDEPSSWLDVKQRLHAARTIRSILEADYSGAATAAEAGPASAGDSGAPGTGAGAEATGPSILGGRSKATVRSDRYVIVVEHDLAVLDYLSDHVSILYGEPGAYGVVSLPAPVRDGINMFLDGFIPAENLRFRDTSFTFRLVEHASDTIPGESETEAAERKSQSKGPPGAGTAAPSAASGKGASGGAGTEAGAGNPPASLHDLLLRQRDAMLAESAKKPVGGHGKPGPTDLSGTLVLTRWPRLTVTLNPEDRSTESAKPSQSRKPGKGSKGDPAAKVTRVAEPVRAQSPFTLTVEAGHAGFSEIVVMLGENGMGKTTMIRLLAGKLEPDSGLKLPELRVSYKPQVIAPKFPGSVEELLQRKIPDSVRSQHFVSLVIRPLRTEALFRLPVKALSGGELQRVALTLCLGTPADIYLIDEPSCYLDSETRIAAAKVIRRFIMSSERTAFVVEHDLIMASYMATRVISFEGVPSRHATAHSPQSLLRGMNMFLRQTELTFRRDPENFRPRINKPGSRMDRYQKSIGQYFYVEARDDLDPAAEAPRPAPVAKGRPA